MPTTGKLIAGLFSTGLGKSGSASADSLTAFLLDFFAGSGTTGEAAARNGRRFLLVDESAEAVKVMRKRLAKWI